jgi:hypothetical protein
MKRPPKAKITTTRKVPEYLIEIRKGKPFYVHSVGCFEVCRTRCNPDGFAEAAMLLRNYKTVAGPVVRKVGIFNPSALALRALAMILQWIAKRSTP